MTQANCQLVGGRVHLPVGLKLSLQRGFVADWNGDDQFPVRSYGRMPFLTSNADDVFLAPVRDGEVTWIGLESSDLDHSIDLEIFFPKSAHSTSISCPKHMALTGVPEVDNFRPFKDSDDLLLMHPQNYHPILEIKFVQFLRVQSNLNLTDIRSLDRSRGYIPKALP
ncbi:hypothetical protein [Phaeobacter sp. 22II1-1F12B]|uniref:hypothetical protein n=1 Tax=Phaeobacter sp. 22II1-1F12B TaxID=1317111 RepID=UPI001185025E|nr:hypothetical protein [Phaeobacter sp. 22II1-1F12B]